MRRVAISVAEATAATGLSRSTIARLIRHKLLPSSKVLGRRLVDRVALEMLVREGATLPPDPTRKRDGNRDGNRGSPSRR